MLPTLEEEDCAVHGVLSPPVPPPNAGAVKPIRTGGFRDNKGKLRTASLFREFAIPGHEALYTIRDEDVGPYRSLRVLYLGSNDPTEYRFAKEAFESWEHFQLLVTNCKWFRELLSEWRAELEIKLRSEALARIVEIALSSKGRVAGSTKLAASKYLAEAGWKQGEPKRRAGRPTKEEVEGELKKEARRRAMISDDASRVGIVT